MSIAKSKLDDLEEGEIKDDAFEDISECSLSEALVLQEDLKDDSDVELLREEALKSLREDEVTEEELYRLEALKSLLNNMESAEKISPVVEIGKKKRKRKKRIRRQNSSKYFKANDVCKKSEMLVESSKEWISTSQVDNSTSNTDFSNKENQIDSNMKLVTRSWYPKTDFALLNSCPGEISSEVKQQPKKHWGNDDFIIVPRILSVANSDIKSTINESIPKGKPVNLSLKLNHAEIPATRASMPISKLNYSVLPLAPHLSRYKKVSKHHIREYPVTQPANRYSLRNVRKGKYKIINKSCYTLKKSTDSPLMKTEKPNTVSTSVYSINRVKNQPLSSKPSEFIIELDEDDSGKEDNGSVIPDKQQNLGRIPSELNNLDELACSELTDDSTSCMAENGSLDQGITEMSLSVVEKETNVESFETSLDETQNEISVDLKVEEEMALLEVTTSTPLPTNCCDTLTSEIITENISPCIYSEEMNSFNETDVSKVTSDAVDECNVSFPTHFSSLAENQQSLEEPEFLNPAAYFGEEYNTHSIVEEEEEIEPELKVTSDVVEGSYINFPTHSNFFIENEQSKEEPTFLNAAACFGDEYNTHFIVKDEEIEPESIENLKMKENMEIDDTNGTETDDCENLRVLEDAEADLIEIRARLLLNLDELEESMKRDESERGKLNTMLRKLLVLKSTIFKFEDKIRAHQSKLSIHADTMQALFKDITLRTDTCAQMKNVCFRVGMEIMGPNYKPPDVYENVIEEKIKTIDFSKYVPNLK